MRENLRLCSHFAASVLVACAPLCGFAAELQKAADLDVAAQTVQRQLRDYVFQNMLTEKPDANVPSKTDGQAEAFVGREDLYAIRGTGALPDCVPLNADPVQLIARRASQTSIVIINEHHASPMDRDFVGRVLTALRTEGYSIYAAETFSQYNNVDHVDALGFDGWYSNEPIFGRTIRLAKTLGYSLVPYEQKRDQMEEAAKEAAGPESVIARRKQIARREQSQTDNLMASIFKSRPDAKVVIHVGHSHVRERAAPSSVDDGNVWMAQRLKEATGRDPLTISQVDCRSPTARVVIGKARLAQSGEGEIGSPVDLYVGHPRPEFQDGRPAWRQSIGDRVIEVPAAFRSREERVIIEARPEGAGLGVIPVDRLLLFPGENLPLLLPLGRYRIDGFVEKARIESTPVVVDVE